MRLRIGFATAVLGLQSLLHPLPAPAQGCLGLPERINRLEVGFGAAHQNDRQRFGGQAQVFAGGSFGLALGTRFGTLDEFAESGYELNVLVGVPFQWGPLSTCGFGEYEQAKEEVRNSLDLTNGDFLEKWARLGVALTQNLGHVGDVGIGLSGGPEVIWRITGVEGRTTYVEDEIYVLEFIRRETAFHFGGRIHLSLRHRRGSLQLGLKNRPRRGPDLLWTAQVGFPL